VRHVPAAKGQPALLITNHQSFLDPWLIAIAPGRQIHYMARDTLFQGGFMHWMMETHNTFPVKRGHGDRASIRVAAERLEKGYIVNIFPEGTRSLDGTIGPIAPGLSLILRGCKRPVPVIPVLIDGAFEAWPRTKKLPRPHAIKVIYGSPITPEEIAGLSAGELAVRIRRELVALQAKVGSVHAEASARRLATEGSERPRV
jgi:1-acyl-sn-glycerol-3-phosphate acyltransferase